MATSPTPNPSHSLLLRAHSPTTASSILQERVLQRPLPLHPTQPSTLDNARSRRQHERLVKLHAQQRLKNKKNKPSSKPHPFSAKQKRALRLYDVPKSQQKYSVYEPLHALWRAYMRSVLNLGPATEAGKRGWVDATGAGPVLVSADYHGAKVEVVRSRCGSRVGVGGIVVKDTKFTFEVVTRRDEVKVLPKEGTVFRFEVPFDEEVGGEGKEGEDGKVGKRKPLVFEIYGSQFECRAPERANRKFRLHWDPDL